MHEETRQAILRACRYIGDDRRVLSLTVGPHEGVTIEDVAKVRATLHGQKRRGRVPKRFKPQDNFDDRQLAYEMRQQEVAIRNSTTAFNEKLAAHYG